MGRKPRSDAQAPRSCLSVFLKAIALTCQSRKKWRAQRIWRLELLAARRALCLDCRFTQVGTSDFLLRAAAHDADGQTRATSTQRSNSAASCSHSPNRCQKAVLELSCGGALSIDNTPIRFVPAARLTSAPAKHRPTPRRAKVSKTVLHSQQVASRLYFCVVIFARNLSSTRRPVSAFYSSASSRHHRRSHARSPLSSTRRGGCGQRREAAHHAPQEMDGLSGHRAQNQGIFVTIGGSYSYYR